MRKLTAVFILGALAGWCSAVYHNAEQIVSEWADAIEHSRMRSPDNGPHADKTGIVSATGCGVKE